jgi:uncharacterized protein with HEPN domain
MSRVYRLYLQDIVDAAHFIERLVQGQSYEEFTADEVRLSAVLHKLTLIGEAIKHVPDEIRDRYPSIPWREIAGTRDVIVHGYFKVNLPLIWHAVSVEIVELRQQIERILEDSEQINQEDNE